MRRIRQTDIVLNEPLPWSLYDAQGHLLLRQGYIVSMPQHLDSLLARGCYVKDGSEEKKQKILVAANLDGNASDEYKEPVFSRADSQALWLKRLFSAAVSLRPQTDLAGQFEILARQLIKAADDDVDSLLAAIHLDRHNPYRIAQQYCGAALVACLSAELNVSADTRHLLVCAALTRDIGLAVLDEELGQISGQLSPEQWRRVRAHPVESVKALRRHGVEKTEWLKLVVGHHERHDGSGYPTGAKGDSLSAHTMLLGLADSYSALVLRSPRRRAMFPANALRELFLVRDSLYDTSQVMMLVKFLTRYPPGSMFKLSTGEIAVACKRPVESGSHNFEAYVLYNAQGMPILSPRSLTIDDPDNQISSMVHVEDCRSSALVIKRLWLTQGQGSAA